MNSRRILWAVTLVLGCVLGAVAWWGPSYRPSEATPGRSALLPTGGNSVLAEGEEVAEDPTDYLGKDGGRERVALLVAAPGVSGFVRDRAGDAVAEAQVTWTPHRLGNKGTALPSSSLDEILEATLSCVTDASGHFDIAIEDVEGTGVLWATRPGYVASWITCTGSDPKAVELTLEQATEVLARVESRDGRALDAATVVQRGAPGSWGVGLPLSDAEFAQQLYVRRSRTDGKGESQLPSTGFPCACSARIGELASPEVVSQDEAVVLVVDQTITLQGQVHADFVDTIPAGATLFCFSVDAEGIESLVREVPLPASGSIEDLRLPWNQGGAYRLIAEGPGLPRGESLIEAAGPGASVAFEIRCLAGGTVALHFKTQVVDEGGVARMVDVAGVTVSPGWLDEAASAYVGPVRPTISNAKGIARVDNVPKAFVYCAYSADGFVSGFTADMDLGEPTPDPIEVVLQRSGVLNISVDEGGSLAQEFTAFYWLEGQGFGEAMYSDVLADDQGVAALEGVPIGNLHVLAIVAGRPQTPSVLVETKLDEDAEVRLEVPAPVVGVGLVLDADTRLPVTEAVIQISLVEAGGTNGHLDDGHVVEPDGSFDLPFFAKGLGKITATAPGYSPLVAMGNGGRDGRIDFGTILLSRTQPLVIQCKADHGIDWTQYTGSIWGSVWSPDRAIEPDGRYTVGAGQHGQVHFVLKGPDGSVRQQAFVLKGRGPWVREFALGGATELSINFDVGGEAVPAHASIVKATEVSTGSEFIVHVDPDRRSCSFGGVSPGAYALRTYDADWNQTAATSIEVPNEPLVELAVPLEGKGFGLRLLTKSGDPIPGAWLALRDPDHMPNVLYPGAVTDEGGVATMPEIPLDFVMVEATLADGGFMSPTSLAVPPGDHVQDLVWNVGPGLFADFVDGASPLEGLEVWIHESQSGFPVATLGVPASGHFERSQLSPGSYFADPQDSWVWDQRVDFEIDDRGTPVVIEFRQLGDLTVSVKSLLNNPAPGVTVELVSDEFGESVSDWVDAGRVSASGGLVTGADGQLHLEGLPHGSYTWYVGGSKGSVVVSVGKGSMCAVQLEQ